MAKIVAVTIMMRLQLSGEIPNPFQSILTSNAVVLAMVATLIQPK